jgi:hypothetical protein
MEWGTNEGKLRIKKLLSDNEIFNHFGRYFDHFASVIRNDVWDYHWLYSRWNAMGCSIVPCINLMKNVGFGPDATHTVTFDHPQATMQADKMEFPLKHRAFKIDREYDRLVFKTYIRESRGGVMKKLKWGLKKISLLSGLRF